jgi:cell division transport system permease protein
MTLTKLVRNSLQHIARNKGLAFASIMVMTLTFLIMFTFLTLLYSVTKMIDYMDKKIPVIVMVENTATPDEMQSIEKLIKTINPTSSFEFHDKNFSLAKYLKDNEGTPYLTYGVTAEFFPGYYEVSVQNQKDALDLFDKLLQNVSTKLADDADTTDPNLKLFRVGKDQYSLKNEYKFLYTVILRASTSKFLNDFKATVQVVGLAAASFLIIVSLVIIYVTTSMTIYTSKDEIETMELVGATPAYIRIPYIFDGAFFGFIGAMLSTGILYGTSFWLVNNNDSGVIPFFRNFFKDIEWTEINMTNLAIVFAICLAVGSLIGALAAAVATRKYLK